jgi:hypothetical protein
MKTVDLTGQRFGRLVVYKCLGSKQEGKRKYIWWMCKCDCGQTPSVRTGHLTSKNGTRSCGCLGIAQPLPQGEASFNQILERYKRQARSRGIKFELTKEEFKNLITSNCFYCDSFPTSVQNSMVANGSFTYSGVDRVDSSKDYTMDNCVSCCKVCNFMKRSMSTADFYNQIEKIYKSIVAAVA